MGTESHHLQISMPALLRHARATYARAMRAALAQAGYDDIPANGLYLIGGLVLQEDGVSIGQLVRQLAITKQGAGQLVDTLVTRGYLKRTPDETDRRQLIVTLTERGVAAAATQAAARNEIDDALSAAVSSSDLEATHRTLVTLIDIGRPQTDADTMHDQGAMK